VGFSTVLCANDKQRASAEVIEISNEENKAGPPAPTGGGASRPVLAELTNANEALARGLQHEACAYPPLAGAYLGCINVLYLSVCFLILSVYEEESLAW